MSLEELEANSGKLQLAMAIWQELDPRRQGYTTAQMLKRWLEEQAGFLLADHQVNLLYDCFNCREADFRIGQDKFFLLVVNVNP